MLVYPFWGEKAYQHEIEGNNAFACTFCHFIFRANITKSVFNDKNTWIWQIQFFSPLVLLGKHMLYASCLSSHTKLLTVKTVLYKMVQHNNKTFDLLHFQYTCPSEALPWAPLVCLSHCDLL